jgi:hypothetical protein
MHRTRFSAKTEFAHAVNFKVSSWLSNEAVGKIVLMFCLYLISHYSFMPLPPPPPTTTPAYLRVLVPSSYRKDEWTLTRGKHIISGSNDVTNSWSPYWKTLFITTKMSSMMNGQWTPLVANIISGWNDVTNSRSLLQNFIHCCTTKMSCKAIGLFHVANIISGWNDVKNSKSLLQNFIHYYKNVLYYNWTLCVLYFYRNLN